MTVHLSYKVTPKKNHLEKKSFTIFFLWIQNRNMMTAREQVKLFFLFAFIVSHEKKKQFIVFAQFSHGSRIAKGRKNYCESTTCRRICVSRRVERIAACWYYISVLDGRPFQKWKKKRMKKKLRPESSVMATANTAF